MAKGPYTGTTKKTTIPGSQIEPDYRVRRITYYPVDEGDMETVTHINTEMSVCVALGTFFLGILVTMWLGLILTPPTDKTVGAVLMWGGTIVLGALVAASVASTVYFYRRRESVTNRIYNESGGRTVVVAPKPKPIAVQPASSTAGSQL